MSIVDYRVVEGRVDLDPQAQEFLGASELLCILRVRCNRSCATEDTY